MRIIPLVLLAAWLSGGWQSTPEVAERGVLRLHYVQKAIGYERYTVSRDGDGLSLAADFDFTDRGCGAR